MDQFEIGTSICQERRWLEFQDFPAAIADEEKLRAAIRPPDKLVNHPRGVLGDALVSGFDQTERLLGLRLNGDLASRALFGQPGFDGRRGDRRELREGIGIGIVKVPRHRVEHAECAEIHPCAGGQRHPGIETYVRRTGDDRTVGETLVERGVRHDEWPVLADGVRAKGHLARQFAEFQTTARFEPQSIRVHQGDERNRNVEELGGQRGDPLELRFGRGVQ